MQQPQILPSEYMEQGKELAELGSPKGWLAHAGEYYVKGDWTSDKSRNKLVTRQWISFYNKGLGGTIPERTSFEVLKGKYLGLCRVRLGTRVGEMPTCECELYNLYLTCPHSIGMAIALRLYDFSHLDVKLGRVRKVGRNRRPGGALQRDDDVGSRPPSRNRKRHRRGGGGRR